MASSVRERPEARAADLASAPPIVHDLQRVVNRYSKASSRSGSADYWLIRSPERRLSMRIYFSVLKVILRDLLGVRREPVVTQRSVRTGVPSPGLREMVLTDEDAEELQSIVQRQPSGPKRTARPVRRVKVSALR